MKPFAFALAIGLATAPVIPASAADITGAGATFPFPVYSKWAETYRKETGTGLNYQSIGSGGGIKQIQARTVDFGATDAPLKGETLEKDGLVQFPTVMGGVVAVVNVPNVKTGEVKLTGEVLAEIYQGKIRKWSDPKIAKRVAGLRDKGVRFLICRKTLEAREIDWRTLPGVQEADIVPSGVAEIAKLEGEGFAYIHP